ncbi:hypothetical protein N7462_010243, partial [Penicillium macrosclerotiorum]|uniref:uncharacterized protein n=1 Tax=Penicillium macrosclerotiorum TaxID=303699 RepID=UPI0025492160
NQESFQLINSHLSFPSHGSRNFNITAAIEASNRTLHFNLENNDDLVSQHMHIQYLANHGSTGGSLVSLNPHVQFTRGSVWMQTAPEETSKRLGWAGLAIIHERESILFEGIFTIMDTQYAVELKALNDGSTGMIASKVESEFPLGNRSVFPSYCATASESLLNKRQFWNTLGDNDLAANIGNTAGCPGTRQIAQIGIMADCTYTASFSSSEAAHQYILNMVNTASVVFENSFNITLGIRNLTISDAECPSSFSDMNAWNAPCSQGNLNTRLQNFSRWRERLTNDKNAYWTLLTGCSVSAGEIGVSWIGALCNLGSGYSNGGASANVVARTQTEWQVFAHESAHMFGAVHDCTADTCETQSSQCCPLSANTCDAGGQYIMNPVSGSAMTRFSPCTIGTVCSRLGSGQVDGSCLVNSQTGYNGECGNGIVESGEACDCGNGACDEREAQCCDSATCQWRGGDDCDQSDTGDTENHETGNDQGSDSPYWVQTYLPLIIGLSAGVGGGFLLLLVGF